LGAAPRTGLVTSARRRHRAHLSDAVGLLKQSQTPRELNRLLAAVPQAVAPLMSTHMKIVALSSGEILHEPGEPIDYVYFPRNGFVSLVTVMRSGQAIENAMIGREGAVGTKSAFGRKLSLTRAVVQASGTAARISAPHFQIAVMESPGLRELIARFNEVLVAQIQQTAACYAAHNLHKRLCGWLLAAADHADGQTIQMTQERLAQTLGVHRGRLNAVLRGLQRQDLIRYYQRGDIRLNRPRLEAETCECYRVIQRFRKEQ